MPKIARCFGLLGGLLLAGAAQAVMLDLTDGSWSGFNNHTSASRTFGNNQVSLSTGGTGRMRFTRYDGGRDTTPGLLGMGRKNDGLGINDDEISYGKEHLTAQFSNAVTLNSVQFLDLYGAGPGGDPMAEGAGMLIGYAGGGSTFLSALGTEWGGAGYLDFAVGLSDVMSISFFTGPGTGLAANSDFALAGMDLTWASGADQKGATIQSVSQGNDPRSDQPRAVGLLKLTTKAQSIPAPGLPWLMVLGLALLAATGRRWRAARAGVTGGTNANSGGRSPG